MKLKDKVAVITGGGRGIGRAIAVAFAQEGADVAITARTAGEIEKVAAEVQTLGRKGVAIMADMSQRTAVAQFVEQVFTHFPTVHILVNNAGIGSGYSPNPIVEYDDAFWDRTLMINLTVPYLLTKGFLPKMVAQGWGRIINISSVMGKIGLRNGCAYSVTKHGLIGLTRTAALEVADKGVTVNAICPGPTRTLLLEKRLQYESERIGVPVEKIEKRFNPMRRLMEPEEVASLAVYLVSEEAQAITGQALNIDGGSITH